LSTLYGTLCLINRVDDLNILSSNYNDVLNWIAQSFDWLIKRSYIIQLNNISNQDTQNESECINAVLIKMFKILSRHTIILNDMVPYLATFCRQGKGFFLQKTILELKTKKN
jgi:hypothetical protein